jgi:hypothetical protein
MSETELLIRPSEDQDIVRSCCQCRRIWTGDEWREPSETPRGMMSHGICRDCFLIHYPGFPLPDER